MTKKEIINIITVAVKWNNKDEYKLKELKIMKKLKHPNITKLIKPEDEICILEDEIQMEIASYDLFKLIEYGKTKNNLNTCMNIWNSINRALEYMHSLGYTHQIM